MKGDSESRVRDALNKLGEDMPLVVYKPPDDARNRKPADYLVWFGGPVSWVTKTWSGEHKFEIPPPGSLMALGEGDQVEILRAPTGSAMIEVKETPNRAAFPFSGFTKEQRLMMRESVRIGVPYWVAIWWRRPVGRLGGSWTVSDGHKIIAFIDDPDTPPIKSVHWTQLTTNMGIDCSTDHLPGVLGAALRGEIG